MNNVINENNTESVDFQNDSELGKNQISESSVDMPENEIRYDTKNDSESENRVQTLDERRKNAEMRRRFERENLERETQNKINDIIKSAFAGQKDPITGQAITNEQQMREYKAHRAQLEVDRMGLSSDALNELISNHPVVSQAQQSIQRANDEKRIIEMQRAEEELNREIKIISSLDPEINSVEDIFKSPKAAEIDGYVRRGFSVSEAYKMANFDKLSKAQSARARQEVINSVNSKNHLKPIEQKASAEIELEVPDETLAIYRHMFPELSMDEIKKDYNKRNRKG